MLLCSTKEITPQGKWWTVSKEAIMDSANSYFGVTGNTSLNAVGDRANGRYDYWEVVAKDVGGVAPTFSWNSTTDE
jgi:ABC-type branched-subunit amino acid transport system substrate-binding protein